MTYSLFKTVVLRASINTVFRTPVCFRNVFYVCHVVNRTFYWILRHFHLKLATDTTVWVHVCCVTDVMPFCKSIEVVKRKQADGEFQNNGFD